MRKAMTLVFAAALTAAAVASAAELQSGLQNGESVGAFTVEKCAGAVDDNVEVGKNLCYRCMLGSKPVVMVFARKADKNLGALVKELDKAVASHSDQKLSSFVNLIGEKPDDLKKAAKDFAKENQVKNVALVVPEANENGPPEFNISPNAEVTVMLYTKGKVEANYAVAPGQLDSKTIAAIIGDTSKILK